MKSAKAIKPASKPKPDTKPKDKAKSPSKAKTKAKARPKLKPRRQYGALPYRGDGELEILLVTTRETGRWMVPKGWPMIGKSPRAAAAREALEEAGVVGKASKSALGRFDYRKVLKTGEVVPCRVTVFALQVAEQKPSWPEQDQRQTGWFPAETAADLVQEPGLKLIIRAFGQGWRARESRGR